MRPLGEIGKYEKETLPEFAHPESTMGSVTVMKKSLRKQRYIPYRHK
jgi:hypothetical protein